MAKIIAVNAGSSSLKFQLLSMPEEMVLAKGLVERIGSDKSQISLQTEYEAFTDTQYLADHYSAAEYILTSLVSARVIHSLNEIDGIGHRIVHGGEEFSDSVLITEDVIKVIERLSELAPLHNPANLHGIQAFQAALPNSPSVAVFDTSFHQTMKKEKFLYSVPYEYYEKYGVRKYGFHGTSHKYVSQRAAELIGKPIEELKMISCHIGNGVSITAIDGGRSIDTSMGFTPLAGVAMGTRSGNIDPALIPYIMHKTGHTAEEVIDDLNNKSGLLGLSGVSNDLRDIVKAAENGDERAKTALAVYTTRIHKYVGIYAASLNGVDAIIFTAGVGENSEVIREKVCTGLEFMGVKFDNNKNGVHGKETFINKDDSKVKVLVIPTNEELMIARDTFQHIHTSL